MIAQKREGVLLPEAILEYEDFAAEVVTMLPSPPANGRLFIEQLELLD